MDGGGWGVRMFAVTPERWDCGWGVRMSAAMPERSDSGWGVRMSAAMPERSDSGWEWMGGEDVCSNARKVG